MFRPRKSICAPEESRPGFSGPLETQLPAVAHRESSPARALSGRPAQYRVEQGVDRGAREVTRQRLRQQPAVQRAAPQRARFADEGRERQLSARADARKQGPEPGLQRLVILLQQFAGPRGAGNRVALRRFAPGREHLVAHPIAEKSIRGVGGILSPARARGPDESGAPRQSTLGGRRPARRAAPAAYRTTSSSRYARAAPSA